ncbi:MAG TPA: YihY family inner membrane protein [Burkholderiales bacterium]|jgi:membrane protein|nr:YihY family inner membrane protein [Burkholderiales bacterium]
MKTPAWRKLAQFCMTVVRRFYEDRSSQTAGSLTYTTLLALVPLLTVALTVTTAFPIFDRMMSALQDFVVDHVLPDTPGVDTFAEQLSEFSERAGRLRAISLAALGVTALMTMHTIEDSLNRIFRVSRPRLFAKRLAMYVVVLVVGPVLIGASVSMTTFLVVNSLGALNLDSAAESVLAFLPFVLTCTALTLLYILVPNRDVAVRHALLGGVVAGVAFELAKRAFAFYVSRFPTYTLVYGTFATMLLFLVWMYVSWYMVLAGATLTAMLPAWNEDDAMKGQP